MMLLILLLLSGCNTSTVTPSAVFYKDVQPIFKTRCFECHGNRWSEYKEVYKWRTIIYDKVVMYKSMPPKGMPKQEIELIKVWVNKGAKP